MIVTKTVVRLFGLAKATCGVVNAPAGGGPSRGGGWEAGVRMSDVRQAKSGKHRQCRRGDFTCAA
jgi:hypothetical protein